MSTTEAKEMNEAPKPTFDSPITSEEQQSGVPGTDPPHSLSERGLKVQRAYPCLIHKLTPDELMMIFEIANQEDWRAPQRISAVCRRWRMVVRMAPRAWSNIYLPDHPSVSIISWYLASSHPYLLHLATPPARIPHTPRQLGYIAVVGSSVARIACLSIGVEELDILPGPFANLRRLQLTTYSTRTQTSSISRQRFPVLRSFHAQYFQSSSLSSLHNVIQRPPIQHLTIATDTRQAWLEVLSALHSTLISLRINIREFVAKSWRDQPLFLPRLQYLQMGPDHFNVQCEFVAETPSLRSYIPAITIWSTKKYSVEVDFSLVTHLRLENIAPIEPYISLVHLQLTFPPVVLVEHLETNPHLCPDLEMIEYLSPRGRYEAAEEVSLSNWAFERNVEEGVRQVQVVRCTEYHSWRVELPGQYPRDVGVYSFLSLSDLWSTSAIRDLVAIVRDVDANVTTSVVGAQPNGGRSLVLTKA